MASKKAETKTTIDPFKVKASSGAKPGSLDVLVPADDLKESVEEFVRITSEIKHLEGEKQLHDQRLKDFAKVEFSSRQMKAKDGNFRISGTTTSVLYIVQDKSAGHNQDDYNTFKGKYGEKATKDLLEMDFASFRINPEAMKDEKNQKKISDALAKLSEELGVNILLPGGYKACEGALVKARGIAKDQKQFAEMIEDLKITKYLRS